MGISGRSLVVALAVVFVFPISLSLQTAQDGRMHPGKEWPAPGGDWGTSRYSTLSQIDAGNAARLGGAWVTQLPDGEVSRAYTVVADGRMFITTTRGRILALDPATGDILWSYTPEGRYGGNRGVGVGEGLLFAGLADSTVIAVDQRTGALVWTAPRDPALPSQGMTAQPVYGGGVVVATVSGADNFARGRAIGYDAKTGKQLWVFEVIPEPGQPGHETWPTDSDIWKYGGGAIWTIPAIDADLGLVYVVTGNAVPQFAGEIRPGDNLFTNSVVALDLESGTLRWHFQLVHHDIWEHDVSTGPVLYDATVNGKPRKAVAVARTDGYFFLFDRATGEPILPIEERPVKQDAHMHTSPTQPFPVGADRIGPECALREHVPEGWETGCYFDPIRSDMPNVFMPHMTLRHAPVAHSPQTGYLYAAACVRPKWIRRVDNPWIFVFPTRVPGVSQFGLLAAVDTRTNRIAWQRRMPYAECAGSGATVTAGGLMLHNTPDGKFQAYNARTGDLLWQFETGEHGVPNSNGNVGGPIATYEVNGEQHIAFVMNRHVWSFKLGGTIPERPAPPPLPITDEWEGRIDEVTTIRLGVESVNRIPNANREEEWSNPFAVVPARVRTTAGTALTFTNTTGIAHTIRARDGSWTTGTIAAGESASVRVTRPGTYEYVCEEHPWSIGQLIVE
jgi:quinohemoprotein ethanol dehydrogenase